MNEVRNQSRRDEMHGMDIHTWFSLSYANYLVIPRSVLQSMPEDWQVKFTELLDEAQGAFSHLEWPSYDVRTLKREPEVIRPRCDECEGEGSIDADGNPCDATDESAEQCPPCAGYGRTDDYRYETPEEVGFRQDPIPHYNRGRTKLEPRYE